MTDILYRFAQIYTEKEKGGIPGALSGGGDDSIANALQLVFGIAGAIALLIVVIGALQYVLSQGNPQSTAKAKDTILYAIIGLVICAFAFSIVTFVVGNL